MAQPAQNAEGETSVNRRTGNHHPNIWSDDFIQSLSSQYQSSLYHGRVEALIAEVKNIFNSLLSNGESTLSPYDLLERLLIVDIVHRLGIDRYFPKELETTLQNVYKFWNENVSGNASADLNTTAFGFRILRLNGYDVSSDVFQIFKNEKGHFLLPESTQQDAQLRCILNLYQASELSFQGERILKEAEHFARPYLEEALEKSQIVEKPSQLLHEVEYVLKYPWICRVPRWEARCYIEIYSHDDSWIMMKEDFKMLGKKILELAILDFNILQAQHQTELKLISQWWNESRVKQLNFFRHRHVEYFFWWSCALFEPEFGTNRIDITKLCILLTLFDDIYDTYGTIEELKPFTSALIKWDKIIDGSLPEYMKISFEFAYETLVEIETKAKMKHGPHVSKYMKQYWERYILSYLKEAEWIATCEIPTFDEYLKNGIISVAVPMATMHALILMETSLPEDILEKINKIENHVSCCVRLLDDSRDFQDEKLHGENASCIECYVKENPGSTREDALNYINVLLDNTIQQLKWEFLRKNDIPTCCKKLYFDAALRGLFFLYKDTDGLTLSHNETKDAILKIFVEPINI